MRRACALLLVLMSGCNTLPQTGSGGVSPASFGEQFTGTTVDFYEPDGIDMVYRGSERFLPANRTVLLQDGRCYEGSWEQAGGQICYTYPDLLEAPRHCFRLDAPITADGLVTLRTNSEAFELRNTNRPVPAACPR